MASLPMSWSSPPSASPRSRTAGRPSSSPTWTERSATRRVCSSVYASFSARETSSARTCEPRNASSCVTSSTARRLPRGPRLAEPVEIEGDRDADERDTDQLEAVTEPPAEIRVVEDERGQQRRDQPDDADGDQQIGESLCQAERPERPDEEERVQADAAAGSAVASGLRGSGTDGTSVGSIIAASPRARMTTIDTLSSQSSGRTAPGRPTAGRADSARMAPPTGSVRPPVSATTPFEVERRRPAS